MAYAARMELGFTIHDAEAPDLIPFRMQGVERISQPFRFEVDCLCEVADHDITQMIDRPATLSIKRTGHARDIHGVVGRLSIVGQTADHRVIMRAILVPRLERLAWTRQTQIYGTDEPVTVPEIISDVLLARTRKGPASTVTGRMGADDVELHLSGDYPERDYVLQYQETDLAFVSRLAEQAGIFYLFDHASGSDRVVFGDSNLVFEEASNIDHLPFRTMAGAATEESVFEFTGTASPVPSKVYLRDYNWRMPHVSLLGEAQVSAGGAGVAVEFGDNFRTPAEADALARVRAEELLQDRLIFEGRSDCVHLSAAHLFELAEHFVHAFDGPYLVVAIEHNAALAVDGVADLPAEGYTNRFTCIPKSVAYRPPRITPKPVVPGLTYAVIDASTDDGQPELDEHGRYKVRHAFDLRGEGGARASRYVRKAEPYGGSRSGMHFPLPKGTEVVLSCVNGDPDRPVIVGTLPNARNRSVVTGSESNVNRMRTIAGTVFEMGDGDFARGDDHQVPSAMLTGDRAWAADETSASEPLDEWSRSEQRLPYARINVPAKGTPNNATYLRLGSEADKVGEAGFVANGFHPKPSAGHLLFAAGDSSSWIKGSRYELVDDTASAKAKKVRIEADEDMHLAAGTDLSLSASNKLDATAKKDLLIRSEDESVTITGGKNVKIEAEGKVEITSKGDISYKHGGKKFVNVTDDDYKFTFGRTMSVFHGRKESMTMGGAASLYLGGNASMSLSTSLTVAGDVSLSVYLGTKTDIAMGFNTSVNLAGSLSYQTYGIGYKAFSFGITSLSVSLTGAGYSDTTVDLKNDTTALQFAKALILKA